MNTSHPAYRNFTDTDRKKVLGFLNFHRNEQRKHEILMEAGSTIEDRLQADAKAFESLLSLTSAKLMFGEDTSDQWQRKKQTKEERLAARKAKLNPENIKTAKDVLDERAQKRKRELEDAEINADAENKKQKIEDNGISVKTTADKRKEKRERKKEKDIKLKEKAKEKQKRRKDRFKAEAKAKKQQLTDAPHNNPIEDTDDDSKSDTETSPEPDNNLSPTSEPPVPSSTSSPPPLDEQLNDPLPNRPKHIQIPDVNHDILKARLKARIEALRAARKADSAGGQPVRSRAELIEQRRQKEDARKQHKKELRLKTKQEEQAAAAEAELARLRGGGGSPLTPSSDVFFSPPNIPENTYSFGRVNFGDGTHLNNHGNAVSGYRRKGHTDARSALIAAEKKHERLSGYTDEKRADIHSKDMWQNARLKIQGEHIKDDVSLLKKTLKRKEKTKSKSEKEWKDREEGVRKAIETKQRKREDNIAKRREEKGNKGKKSKGLSKKKLKNKAFGNLK